MKLKKSLGIANKLHARFAIMVGEDELKAGRYLVRNMETGYQEALEPARVSEYLRAKLNKTS